jgi:hypothetical protein
MRTTCILILTTRLLMAGEEPRKDRPLKPIEYLVGGTWTAKGKLPGVGPYSAERTYRWALGGKFI